MIIVTRAPGETEELGVRLASLVRRGDVVCLRGELGLGKTTLVRGLHRGLGCASRVRSPSFLTLLEYPGDPPLYHFDLYRYDAAGAGFLDEFGEWLEGDGVSVVEWAERFGEHPPVPRLEVRMEMCPEGRRISITGIGGDWAERMAAGVLEGRT